VSEHEVFRIAFKSNYKTVEVTENVKKLHEDEHNVLFFIIVPIVCKAMLKKRSQLRVASHSE
jgi:glycopeptide antibiotics resistance protein